MGNFLKVGDPNFKKYSEKLGEHRSPYLLYCFTTCRHSGCRYIVISCSTNSLIKPEFVIASYCGVEDQMANVHIVLWWYSVVLLSLYLLLNHMLHNKYF